VADEITLTIPTEPEYRGVASIVVGGLAARLDLTIDSLEDLQLALDALLSRPDRSSEDVTIQLRVKGDSLVTRVGPLDPHVLEELEQDAGEDLGVRRLLDSTIDEVVVDGDFAVLTKAVSIER
jgi:hypothetical protein